MRRRAAAAARWRTSAARARRYAPRRTLRRPLRRPALAFELARPGRRGGDPLGISLHARLRLRLGDTHVHVHRARRPGRRTVIERQGPTRERLVRHTASRLQLRTLVRLPARGGPGARPAHAAPAGRGGALRSGPPPAPATPRGTPTRTERPAPGRIAGWPRPPAVRRWAAPARRVHEPARRTRRDERGAVPPAAITGPGRSARPPAAPQPPQPPAVRTLVVRPPMMATAARPAARAAAGAPAPGRRAARAPAPVAPIRMEPLRRAPAERTHPAPGRTAFAPQPRPLAAAVPATRAAPEPPVVERIEKTLRESMRVDVERTVRREVERALRIDAAVSRRLRETIRSELYDDIILERERLGGA
ncbi:MAG TPA: hypothetical protein VF212_11960 [Longimicrobiales bacterium]